MNALRMNTLRMNTLRMNTLPDEHGPDEHAPDEHGPEAPGTAENWRERAKSGLRAEGGWSITGRLQVERFGTGPARRAQGGRGGCWEETLAGFSNGS